ncbi:MAG: hypothetical protein ABJC36_13725 [Gemmatimonadales bacterium]
MPLRHNRAEQLFIAPAQRQAWLQPEYAEAYPEIPPGIWVTAFSAAWAVLGGVLAGARPWPAPGPRVLGERHFIFRGGLSRAPGWAEPGVRVDDP